MKVGDVVLVTGRAGPKYGIVVTHEKQIFMVGPIVEVMIDGEVKKIRKEQVHELRKRKNESKRLN